MSCEEALAVRKSTGKLANPGSLRSVRQRSRPVMLGRFQSRTSRSKASLNTRSSASSPLSTAATRRPTASSIAVTTSRMSGSSSTMSTRGSASDGRLARPWVGVGSEAELGGRELERGS
jgi:hypothetical protein